MPGVLPLGLNIDTCISKVCGKHEKHRYHIDAMVAYDNFLTTSQNPQENIQVQIESKRGSTIKRNREIVKSVAKCVHFCSKQCIAGHRDDSTADQNGNRGNLLALLELRVDSGNEVLKNYLVTCSTNARYSSKTMQNQLIMLTGDHIRNSIIQEIKEAKYFLILCNEVTDNANLEQLSLVLRFVDKGNWLLPHMLFFQFLIVLTATMKTLAVIKPITIKLQKKFNDIVKAYCMISETEKALNEKREKAEAVFKRWYSNAVELSSDLATEPSIPRTASRQQHRANSPHDTPEEYYRRNLFVPFLDHITQEMSSR